MSADNTNEMACVYAALILHDSGIEISEEKIKALTTASGVTVEPYWPGLFTKACAGINMDDLISNIGSSPAPGAAAPGGAAGGAAGEAPKEAEKEESEEEEEEEMDFDLFD